MAHLYFDSTLATQVAADGGHGTEVVLRGPDARHATTVARVRVGERLRLGDGYGLVVHGAVTAVEGGEVRLEVDLVEHVDVLEPRIVLVQALAKGDRDELAVQAATELGVDAVIPWQSARSISRWNDDKARKGRERWSTIVREASKQSLRARIPEVDALATTRDLAARAADGAVLLVLDPLAEHPLSALTAHELGHGEVLLVVGPEGGIAEEEFATLSAAGARRVRLGSTVLRTSTAGPAAIAVLQAALGRW